MTAGNPKEPGSETPQSYVKSQSPSRQKPRRRQTKKKIAGRTMARQMTVRRRRTAMQMMLRRKIEEGKNAMSGISVSLSMNYEPYICTRCNYHYLISLIIDYHPLRNFIIQASDIYLIS